MARKLISYVAFCGLVVCVTAVSLGVFVTNAVARTSEPTIRLHRVGLSSTPVYTDGVRWAVYEPTVGVTRIMDTVKGTSSTRPDPEGCAGGLLAMGGGEILYACSDPECPEKQDACVFTFVQTVGQPEKPEYENARLTVTDITTGTAHEVAGDKRIIPVGKFSEGTVDEFSAIGKQWLVGHVNQYHGGGLFYLNWHSGKVVYDRSEAEDSISRDYVNIESPSLDTSMCKPFERRRAPVVEIGFYPYYFLSQYDAPFLLEERFRQGDEVNAPHRVYLRRCGLQREELVPELKGIENDSAQIGSGILTYYRRVWRLDPRRRPWLSLPYRLIGPPQGYGVYHTSTEIIATAARPNFPEREFREGFPSRNAPARYDVLIARLPWLKKY